MSEAYRLGSHGFTSRLIIGSGKYASFELNRRCAEESGAEMVTVALRRIRLDAPKGEVHLRQPPGGVVDLLPVDRDRVAPAAVLSCGYLMFQLPLVTWIRFGIWLLAGLVLYALYGYRHSVLRKAG